VTQGLVAGGPVAGGPVAGGPVTGGPVTGGPAVDLAPPLQARHAVRSGQVGTAMDPLLPTPFSRPLSGEHDKEIHMYIDI